MSRVVIICNHIVFVIICNIYAVIWTIVEIFVRIIDHVKINKIIFLIRIIYWTRKVPNWICFLLIKKKPTFTQIRKSTFKWICLIFTFTAGILGVAIVELFELLLKLLFNWCAWLRLPFPETIAAALLAKEKFPSPKLLLFVTFEFELLADPTLLLFAATIFEFIILLLLLLFALFTGFEMLLELLTNSYLEKK